MGPLVVPVVIVMRVAGTEAAPQGLRKEAGAKAAPRRQAPLAVRPRVSPHPAVATVGSADRRPEQKPLPFRTARPRRLLRQPEVERHQQRVDLREREALGVQRRPPP